MRHEYEIQEWTLTALNEAGWTFHEEGWYVMWDGATEPAGPDADGPYETDNEAIMEAEKAQDFITETDIRAWTEEAEAYHDQHAEY